MCVGRVNARSESLLIHAALILRYWQLSVVMAAAALADTLLLRYAASRLHTTPGIG